MSRTPLQAAILILCALASQLAHAQTHDWINTSGGTYSTAANWSPAGPPPVGGTARFAIANTFNVTFSGSATTNILTLSQGDVTFFLNGFTFQPTNTVSNGMGATGLPSSLRIANGTFLPGNFSVGGNSGSTSNLLLDAGSNTTVGAGVFYVGTSGTGNVTIQSGADLTTSAGTGLGINASGVGSATVQGAGSTWTVNNTLRVGASGDGSLSVIDGGVVTANALEVGENSGSVGSLSVGGAGAIFTAAGTANIGGAFASSPAAAATLSVGPGATINLNGTTNLRTHATVNVTGGTLNLNTLSVAAGAAVNWSAGTVNFANASAATAAVRSLLLSGTSTLGPNRTLSAASGTLNIDAGLIVNGGTVSAPNIDVNAGLVIGAFGTVTGNEIQLGAGKSVQIENFGSLGASTFIVNNGATLDLNGPNAHVTGFFANNFGVIQGTGRFTAGMNNGTGGTIRANAGDYLIIQQPGLTNPGMIELAGGTVEYTNTLSNLGNGFITGRGVFRASTSNPAGTGVSNLGVMAFSAGTTDIYGDVFNTGGGKIIAAGGSVVTFYDDVAHNGAEMRVNAGSRMVFFGSQTGAGPFTGSGVLEFNGDLKPGNSPALVTMGGDVELGATATLQIELGGTTQGSQYDSLAIDGAAMLSGGLDVSLINGFTPTWGDTFEILTADNGVTGSFSSIKLPELPGLLFWDVLQDGKSISLSVDAPSLPGDFDHNGTVEAADLAVWSGDYGVNSSSDADNDADSDGHDFLIWQQNLGLSIFGATTTADAIPEPTTAMLTLIIGLALGVNLRRFRK